MLFIKTQINALKFSITLRVLIAGLFWTLPSVVGAQDTATSSTPTRAPSSHKIASETIEPPHVLVHVELVRQELEELRAFMGRPKDTQPELGVTEAEPREVFFQALTLFRKADRLCFEQTRVRAQQEPVTPPPGQIQPRHVYGVVEQALGRLLLVKKKLRLTTQFQKEPRDPSKQPSDVLRAIVQANRQLNLLLERQFSPSDVFQQVTVAVGYAERLLERFPEATTMPQAPTYSPYKRPGDVYRRLLDCFGQTHAIMVASNLRVLTLKRPEASHIKDMAPSDVYDIASLLVSELAYLHGQLEGADAPAQVYYPGRKFPSDVYQRAGILQAQLALLAKWVETHPNWLHVPPSAVTGASR